MRVKITLTSHRVWIPVNNTKLTFTSLYLLLLVSTFGVASLNVKAYCHAGKNSNVNKSSAKGRNKMNSYSSTVDTVARLNYVARSSEAQLYLHNPPPLKISVSSTVNHQLFVAWIDILTKRQTDQRPVFVKYETSTNQVCEVISPIVRKVDHVGTATNDGNLKVGFFMAPSMYFIKTSTPNYNTMHQILNDAFHSKKDVLITSDPETLELLDVRLP